MAIVYVPVEIPVTFLIRMTLERVYAKKKKGMSQTIFRVYILRTTLARRMHLKDMYVSIDKTYSWQCLIDLTLMNSWPGRVPLVTESS